MQELLLAAEGLWHLWQRSYEAVDIFIAPSRFLVDLTGRRIPREKFVCFATGLILINTSHTATIKDMLCILGAYQRRKASELFLTLIIN